jgi:hypothetical protein
MGSSLYLEGCSCPDISQPAGALSRHIAHRALGSGLKSVGISYRVVMGLSKGQRTTCGWLERGTQNTPASRIKRTMDAMSVTTWLASNMLVTHTI